MKTTDGETSLKTAGIVSVQADSAFNWDVINPILNMDKKVENNTLLKLFMTKSFRLKFFFSSQPLWEKRHSQVRNLGSELARSLLHQMNTGQQPGIVQKDTDYCWKSRIRFLVSYSIGGNRGTLKTSSGICPVKDFKKRMISSICWSGRVFASCTFPMIRTASCR